MPLSLSLPATVCYPAAVLARKLRKTGLSETDIDQGKYFEVQYETTDRFVQRLLGSFPLQGTLLDLGCGLGGRTPYWLEHGVDRCINLDINKQELDFGKAYLAEHYPQFADRAEWCTPEEVRIEADGAILFDTFEHLADPVAVLDQLEAWLKPGALVWIGSIGWYQHEASHLGGVIPIPWCQVLFSEKALIKTVRRIMRRPDYRPTVWDLMEGIDRWDRVETLRNRPGEPLNLLSLRLCRQAMTRSKLRLVRFDVHGFGGRTNRLARSFAFLAKVPIAQELFHSYYTAVLQKP
jgi:SAM-dependent methyltransferase